MPVGDEIFLDHVGHFVADSTAAAAALARAGFAPTPVSMQVDPNRGGELTGTGNITAMLRRGYVEVLFKTADTPLGRELDAAMARYPGLHLIAFAAADAAGAHRRLGASGFAMRALVEMQRPVDAGGRNASAAFTVARLQAGEMSEGRIQILTHHTEETVWQPRWLTHPNTAQGLAGVVIAVADPQEAAERFARFTGRATRPTPDGRIIDLDRGRIELISADACRRLVPEVPIPALPFIAGYEISVGSFATLQSILNSSGLGTRREGSRLIVPFPQALGSGAWLFTEDP